MENILGRAGGLGCSTLLKYRQKGSPWSLANDHVIREEEATKAIVALIPRTTTTAAIAVVPPVDWTALWKMAMNG